MGGNILIGKPTSEVLKSSGNKGELISDPTGSIRGGLDPEFSPLKTRSAKKLKGVITDTTILSTPSPHVPRALRA